MIRKGSSPRCDCDVECEGELKRSKGVKEVLKREKAS